MFKESGPGITLVERQLTAFVVGEFKQGQSIIAGQDDHRFTHPLLIALHLNSQWDIKQVFFEIGRQALGLGQQATWRGAGCRGSSKRAAAENQGKRCRDGSHR